MELAKLYRSCQGVVRGLNVHRPSSIYLPPSTGISSNTALRWDFHPRPISCQHAYMLYSASWPLYLARSSVFLADLTTALVDFDNARRLPYYIQLILRIHIVKLYFYCNHHSHSFVSSVVPALLPFDFIPASFTTIPLVRYDTRFHNLLLMSIIWFLGKPFTLVTAHS